MTKNKVLFWVLASLSGIALLGALFWYLTGGGETASASGGAVSALLAGFAKQARDKELQALKEKASETHETGQKALAEADKALEQMSSVVPGSFEKDPSGTSSSSEDLTKLGNEFFKGGTF